MKGLLIKRGHEFAICQLDIVIWKKTVPFGVVRECLWGASSVKALLKILSNV
jgi:hypothetical protein